MKIKTVSPTGDTPFKDVKPGEVYRYQGKYFIKTDPDVFPVNLETGGLLALADDTLVDVVKGYFCVEKN